MNDKTDPKPQSDPPPFDYEAARKCCNAAVVGVPVGKTRLRQHLAAALAYIEGGQPPPGQVRLLTLFGKPGSEEPGAMTFNQPGLAAMGGPEVVLRRILAGFSHVAGHMQWMWLPAFAKISKEIGEKLRADMAAHDAANSTKAAKPES